MGVWDIVWSLSKANLYFIYIYRLHITFKGSNYAYPPIQIYIFLAIALLLQAYNMCIFITNIFKATNKNVLIILSSIYLTLNFMLVLLIMFLFLNPLCNLLADLRTKSEQRMKNLKISNSNGTETQTLNENESSSDEIFEETLPHSPTKMGAAYRKIQVAKSPSNNDADAVELELKPKQSSAINPKLRHVHGRMACPEDEIKDEEEDENTNKSSTRFTFGFFSKTKKQGIVWNYKQKQILNTGTRLALLSVIGLLSAFIYQFLWIFSLKFNAVNDFSYTWGIDTCINIICIYLSFHFSEREYNILCTKCCHCHGCCLQGIGRIAKRRVEKRRARN